jgi:hypothetical protein
MFMLLAFALAKLKGYRLKPVLKAYSLYPFIFIELLYLFFQLNIFFRNYFYIQYAPYLKSASLCTLIFPMLAYHLYKPGLFGSASIIFGTLLNKYVIYHNGGKMPVYATLSRLTGYYDESAFGHADNLHVIGTDLTKYKFLTDFIDVGWCIFSIGDLFIHAFTVIIVYYTIKELNKCQYDNDLNKTEDI